MTPRDKREVVALSIRLSPDVVVDMRRYAERDARSLNGQIEWVLKTYIEQQKRAEEQSK